MRCWDKREKHAMFSVNAGGDGDGIYHFCATLGWHQWRFCFTGRFVTTARSLRHHEHLEHQVMANDKYAYNG